MASNEQLKLTIEIAAKNAVKQLQDTAAAAKKAGEAVDAIDPKDVARQFDAATDALLADLRAAEAAADALGQALGPELRAKIGDAGIDNFIGDLKQAGVSFEQVERNADDFAASLRKMDDAASSVRNVDSKLHGMNRTGDNSRSVLANMVGNSAQEIGALAGLAGGAGVAIGQMAEYAADGNVKLSGLAKVAGPLAAVGVAVWGLNKAQEQAAESAKKIAENIEDLSRVSDEAALGLFVNSLTEAIIHGHDVNQMFEDMAENNIEGSRRLLALADAAGVADAGMQGLRDAVAEKEAGDAQAAKTELEHGAAVDGTTDAVNSQTFALKNAAQVRKEINEDRLKAIDLELSLQSAYRSTVDSLGELGAMMKDSEASAYDQANATLSAKQAVASYVEQIGGVPSTKLTEILALIDQGNFQAVLNALNQLAKPRVVPFDVKLGVSVSGGNSPSGTLPPSSAANIGQQIVDDINDAIEAAASKPSKGGGGGGAIAKAVVKKTKEELMRERDALAENMFEAGGLLERQYRDHLKKRLKEYKKYSDDYMRVWRELQALDKADADAKDKAAEAAKKKAEAEQKAREAAAAAKAREGSDAQLQQALNIGTVVVQTSGDTPRRWLDELAWRVT